MYCLVTGGAQGIGRAIVKLFLQRGDRVVVLDCLDEKTETVQSLKAEGVEYVMCDIASAASVQQAFAQIDQQKIRLDVLVNNAGIARDALAVRMREADWDAVLDVNLKGAFLCAQQALKRMMVSSVSDGGQRLPSYIINMSSVVALTGNAGQVAYAASKAGLIALTKSLAQEYANRGILVNAIAPGFIETPMTQRLSEEIKHKIFEQIPLKRFGTVDDVAQMVLFLTSGKADYVTGQVLSVNGGMY
ncbi:3-oxoacyl-ACP reductase FabG [bacterium]|nr:MAG: 3-oxoacyl-ACP reductase FabG [bacterium]